MKALKGKYTQTEEGMAPRKKFAFKARRKGPDSSVNSLASTISSSSAADNNLPAPQENSSSDDGPYDAQLRQDPGEQLRRLSFKGMKWVRMRKQCNKHLFCSIPAGRNAEPGSIKYMKQCVINVTGREPGAVCTYASFTVTEIYESLLILGHVEGPTHVTGVTDSIIVTSTRQLRLHDCKNVDVYLQCASRPIIEDCSGVRFAPLPQVYVSDANKPAQDRWDQVDDFKWLKAGSSPNWSILPDEERIKESLWVDYVSHTWHKSCSAVLETFGVPLRERSHAEYLEWNQFRRGARHNIPDVESQT